MMLLPWEATPGEREAWFRRQLVQAGEKRRLGLCVHPPCAYRARPDGLTCGGPDCLDWLSGAPEEHIHHWRQMEVVGFDDDDDNDNASATITVSVATAMLALVAAGMVSGTLVLLVFTVGVTLRLWVG